MSQNITRNTRLNIFQTLKRDQIGLFGELDDVDFLTRIYDLDAMASSDGRFATASKDIWHA